MMGHSTTKAAGVTGLDLLTQGFEVSGWHAIPADQVWPAPPQGTGLAAGMASAAAPVRIPMRRPHQPFK